MKTPKWLEKIFTTHNFQEIIDTAEDGIKKESNLSEKEISSLKKIIAARAIQIANKSRKN